MTFVELPKSHRRAVYSDATLLLRPALAFSPNNIILTWNTAVGLTNQVRVTSSTGSGVHSANLFGNLSSQLVIDGSGITTTNYSDVGGATNPPSRFYRVRLVP